MTVTAISTYTCDKCGKTETVQGRPPTGWIRSRFEFTVGAEKPLRPVRVRGNTFCGAKCTEAFFAETVVAALTAGGAGK